MKKYIPYIYVFFFMSLALGFHSCQSTKSSTASKMLKFNFENGKGYDYEMIMDMDQELMGQKNEIGMTTYYAMDVIGDEGGVRTIKTTFNSFKMKMSVMGMNIEIDSDQPAAPDTSDKKNPLEIAHKIFRAIKGQQFQMKVDAEGKIVEVTGLTEIGNTLVDSLGFEEEEREKMLKGFSEQFNDASIKEQFERAFFIFPNKEVKVGDSWEKNTVAGNPMPSKFLTTYTVDEIEGDMVTLDVKSKIEASAEGSDVTGTQEGTIVVDSRSGLIMTADMDMDLVTDVKGSKVKMKAKSKIKGKAR